MPNTPPTKIQIEVLRSLHTLYKEEHKKRPVSAVELISRGVNGTPSAVGVAMKYLVRRGLLKLISIGRGVPTEYELTREGIVEAKKAEIKKEENISAVG